jgi:hypothetical protein
VTPSVAVHDCRVDAVTPEEIRGIFFVIGDIAEHVAAIRALLEDEDGEAPEDDG